VAAGAAAALALAAALSGNSATAQTAPPTDPETLTAGTIIYAQICGTEFCHGPRGEGHFLISDYRKLTDDKWGYSGGTYEGIIQVVSNGLPGSPMEPWLGRLGEEKVRQVAAYVMSLSAKE
jgi:mono/diheme cytochrome c family protein